MSNAKDDFQEILLGGTSNSTGESPTSSPSLQKSVQLPSTSKDILSKNS